MTRIAENRIPFGLRGGELVEVSEVESGLACSCVCPSCKRPLQAKKGKINAHHFAHDPTSGTVICASAFETSVHLMAKKILEEDGSLSAPELIIKRTAEDLLGGHYAKELQVEDAITRAFDRVELEKRLDEIRPDIIAYDSSALLLIEVAVTSFADDEKKQKIRKLGLPAIEIDLSTVSYSTTKEDLRNLIHSESTKKTWLSNPKAVEAKKAVETDLNAEIQRANEAIRRSPSSAPVSSTQYPERSQTITEGTGRKIHTAGSREKTRWFVCESCRDVFELPLSAAPPSIQGVTCPNCTSAVSTNHRRTR